MWTTLSIAGTRLPSFAKLVALFLYYKNHADHCDYDNYDCDYFLKHV